MLDPAWGRALIELFAILLLLSLNGLLALSEIAVVSAKKPRLQQLAKSNARAHRALALANEPTDFLATVQIGITTIGILAGALSGATLGSELASLFSRWAWLAPYAELISFTFVVVLVTYLSLMIGELVPKSIALSNPERFAISVAPTMQTFARIMSPVVELLSSSTEWALEVLRIQPTNQPFVTEDELKILLDEGANAGVFEPLEQHIVTRALELDDISLRSLITHRTRVQWLDVGDSAEVVRRQMTENDFASFPLCDGSMDQVKGVVRARDALLALGDPAEPQSEFDLGAIARQPLFVPLTVTPASILHLIRNHRASMVFAIDEYGGIEGIVTPMDILKALIGMPESPPEVQPQA